MSRLRRSPLPIAALALALVAFAPAAAPATTGAGRADPGTIRTGVGDVSFSLAATVGVLEGTASELVYYYPYGKKFKLSELTWDLKDIVMGGVHGSVGIGRRLRVNLGVWSALTEGDGRMVDRDWDYPDSISAFLEPDEHNWTDESRHPDTSLDTGTIVDQNLSVLVLQRGAFSLLGIVGYKHDTWKWSARGGTYVYSDNGFRDYAGAFPRGMKVITYEQQYSIPYVGVGASWARPAFQVESHLLFSPVVSASDSDYHVLRGVLFEEDFSGGTYLGLGLNATWMFASHWSAAIGVAYQAIPEMIGDVTISGVEGSGFFEDGGGIAMSATSVTLVAGYRF